MPVVEFSFILAAGSLLVNLFDLGEFSSSFSVAAGGRRTAQPTVRRKAVRRNGRRSVRQERAVEESPRGRPSLLRVPKIRDRYRGRELGYGGSQLLAVQVPAIHTAARASGYAGHRAVACGPVEPISQRSG